jgi:hypothetical protein
MRMTAQLHLLALRAEEYVIAQRDLVRRTVKGDPERGSITIEQVIWAVAIIAIVAIVVTAITNYVTTQAGKIK